MKCVDCLELPQVLDATLVYRLLPNHPDTAYYRERTDRNIGWITTEEQAILARSVVGIAGCGGMGGLVASILLRAGVGEVRIADCEVFDASNINRQFAARRHTVGLSKVFETARMLRAVTDDTTLLVFPQGITEDSVESFLSGCTLVCDEIEFWAIGARILLHQVARPYGVPIFNCDTVGHRTYLFRFTDKGMPVEDALGFDYKEGKALQEGIQGGSASVDDRGKLMDAVIRVFAPEIPEYFPDTAHGTRSALYRRLSLEGRVSIIATNPPMASGFLANHILFELLAASGTGRVYERVPEMPGYLGFDAALMKTWVVSGEWW